MVLITLKGALLCVVLVIVIVMVVVIVIVMVIVIVIVVVRVGLRFSLIVPIGEPLADLPLHLLDDVQIRCRPRGR